MPGLAQQVGQRSQPRISPNTKRCILLVPRVLALRSCLAGNRAIIVGPMDPNISNADLITHPVPPALLVHIGDITVSFALLELTIQWLIGSLIAEHQRIGQIITAEQSFKSLRALAVSLYKERHGEDLDYAVLRGLMRRAADLEAKRNQITHSIWAAGRTPETITRCKTMAKEKHGIRLDFEDLAKSDLAAIACDLKQLAGEIQRLWMRLLESGKAVNNPSRKIWGTGGEAV